MPGPHDFTVRNTGARLARRFRPLTSCLAPRPHAHTTASRPPHPAPRFVTIGRNAPLHRGGMRETCHRILKNRSKIFFPGGLDRNSRRPPVGQISWRRGRSSCRAALFYPSLRFARRSRGRDRKSLATRSAGWRSKCLRGPAAGPRADSCQSDRRRRCTGRGHGVPRTCSITAPHFAFDTSPDHHYRSASR